MAPKAVQKFSRFSKNDLVVVFVCVDFGRENERMKITVDNTAISPNTAKGKIRESAGKLRLRLIKNSAAAKMAAAIIRS